MPEYVERLWTPGDEIPLSNKEDRRAGTFVAYVPDELGAALPSISGEALAAAEEAMVSLARADERVGSRGRFLNHLLIRSESLSSSWIEGNRVSPKRLAIAELLHSGNRVALDVVANVQATENAVAALSDHSRAITASDIEDLQQVIEPRLARGFRQEQNWVGGPGWSPLRADFVPPPETHVPRLMEDLCRFLTATDGNPVIRAAIAHAQFETIHPFVDGNGRTGRALIHTVLKRSDALRNILIPISTVFAARTDGYIRGLTAFRQSPPCIDDWVIDFSHATQLAAANAVRLAEDVASLDEQLVQQFVQFRRDRGIAPAHPRRDAVSLRLLSSLSHRPVITTEMAAVEHGVSNQAAHKALTELAEAGILSRNKDRGRLVCWSADRHLGLAALTERSNLVGGVDTRGQRVSRGPAAPHHEHVGMLRQEGPQL